MTALHLFGAEMLKLSRGLESTAVPEQSVNAKAEKCQVVVAKKELNAAPVIL